MNIEIKIVLPNRSTRKARIDPSASLDKLKSDIVKGAKLSGNPDDYDMFIAPTNTKVSLQNYRASEGDVFILTEREELSGSSVEFVDS